MVQYACDGSGVATEDEHVVTRVESISFSTKVPPRGAARVRCFAREHAFSVSWEAKARVLFDIGRPEEMTLHGVVSGTQQSDPFAELERTAALV